MRCSLRQRYWEALVSLAKVIRADDDLGDELRWWRGQTSDYMLSFLHSVSCFYKWNLTLCHYLALTFNTGQSDNRSLETAGHLCSLLILQPITESQFAHLHPFLPVSLKLSSLSRPWYKLLDIPRDELSLISEVAWISKGSCGLVGFEAHLDTDFFLLIKPEYSHPFFLCVYLITCFLFCDKRNHPFIR